MCLIDKEKKQSLEVCSETRHRRKRVFVFACTYYKPYVFYCLVNEA